MKNQTKKKIDVELYRFAEYEIRDEEAADEEYRQDAIDFSDSYKKRKRSIIRRFKRPRRGHSVAVAALSLALIIFTSLTANGLLRDFILEVGDKFVAIFTSSSEQASDLEDVSLKISEVPDRFSLELVDKLSNMVFYIYRAENGDVLTVSEENGDTELNMDSECTYRTETINDHEVFIGYKDEPEEYNIYFRYDANTAITITGNLTEDEAMQLIQSATQ